MIPLQSKKILFLSFLLIVGGLALAWLMVLHILTSTFFLNFLSFIAMTAGLFLCAVGMATFAQENRKNGRRR